MRKVLTIISIILIVIILFFLGAFVVTLIKMNKEVIPSYSGTKEFTASTYSSVNKNTFIPWNEIIQTDVSKLNGSNWLSGVSGERGINEINTPVTHDSAMSDTASASLSFGSFFHRYNDAVTQNLHIFDQFKAGVRGLDLRINNKVVMKKNHGSGILKDDGENLYLCHGKNGFGGTFFAKDPNTGYPLSLSTVIDWTEDFLAANPTEYILLDFSPETSQKDQTPIIFKRLDKILSERTKDINPATNEPYFYLEDGVYPKEYSGLPKLKDVRGKILLRTTRPSEYDLPEEIKKDIPGIGGIYDISFNNKYYVPSQEGKYTFLPADRIKKIYEFAEKEIATRNLPTTASPLIDLNTGKEIYLKTCSNCTGGDSNALGIPSAHPYILAEEVNPKIFGKGNIYNYDNAGKFLGWISSDGLTDTYCADMWKTNFFDGLEYVTVTINSNKEAIPTQTFKLLKGSEIVIPDYIYTYQQNDTNGHFNGWKIGDTTYSKGTKYIVNDNVTINATWN